MLTADAECAECMNKIFIIPKIRFKNVPLNGQCKNCHFDIYTISTKHTRDISSL